jgi:hypothetical protein
MRERSPQECVCVAGLGDDLEARLGQQPDDALAQQDIILTDDDANRLWHRLTVIGA